MGRFRRAVVLWLLLCGGGGAVFAAGERLEVIPLRHQTVEQMVQLLRPFVGAEGTVTGMNGQLVIRASPDTLESLKALVDRFDRPPRQLLIHVRQGGAHTERRLDAEAAGHIELGEEGDVTIGAATPESGLEARIHAHRRSWSTEDEHRVRATEGSPAFIQTGLLLPTFGWDLDPWGRPRPGGDLHAVTSGFYVTPWIQGDRVTLEISPFAARPSGTPGRVRIQSLTTRVTGRLGEWIPLGGVHLRREGSAAGTVHYATGGSGHRAPVEVKVDLLP